MRVLILGASGATGRLLVRQLISRGIQTRLLVRESAILPEDILENSLAEIVRADVCELENARLRDLVRGCAVTVSCLGHNLSLKGIFGKPRDLVYDTVRRISEIMNADEMARLILMSTTAYTNVKAGERNSLGEGIIFSLLKLFLPPHRDNVRAADHLTKEIGDRIGSLEWVAVRPDTLTSDEEVKPYDICPSPVRSPIFNAGTISRSQVGHFMAELITDSGLWAKWKYRTPVLYTV
ncbi:NAD(P)-dependent oxidoreductase [Spirochaeta dissipatitropha]